AVLRAYYGERGGCAPGGVSHWLPGPVGEQGLGVLGLGGQQEDVVLAEAELGRAGDGGDVQRGRAVRGGQGQALGAEGVEVGAAGDQDDLVPAGGQLAADRAADRAGPDDDVPYCIDSVRAGAERSAAVQVWPHGGGPADLLRRGSARPARVT